MSVDPVAVRSKIVSPFHSYVVQDLPEIGGLKLPDLKGLWEKTSAPGDGFVKNMVLPTILPRVPIRTPPPSESRADSWKDELIYFVLTDRFNDADENNNFGVNKQDLNRFHGGDLQGLINKLDYIKGLGMSALWLTPVVSNQDSFVASDGYHGYWPVDFYNTDKHLGDMAKFREFVTKAHEKGLKVILDLPLNHTAWEHPFWKDQAKYGWYHHNGDIQDWNDPWQSENCSIFGLPDLAQENPDVERYLTEMTRFWVDTGIDGLRLDAVKNVPVSFWAKFDKEIHDYAGKEFLLLGECFDGNPGKVASYLKNDMDSLLDYPLYFTLRDVFAHDFSMRALASRLNECAATYEEPEMMALFIDNQDTKRFLSEAGGDKNKLKLALAFLMTINRIPIVYYGTEVSMDASAPPGATGGWAETSRKDMEWDKDPDMLSYFRGLTSMRNSSKALREGRMLEMWQDDQVFAYSRLHPEQEAIVVLNNSPDTQTRDIPLRAESQLPDGKVLKDLLSGETVVVKDRKIHVQSGGKRARVLVSA